MADKRFELRLTASQLARWRTFAADQGAKLSDVVRVAMERAAAEMPPRYVAEQLEREGQERLAAALAVFHGEHSVRTDVERADDAEPAPVDPSDCSEGADA